MSTTRIAVPTQPVSAPVSGPVASTLSGWVEDWAVHARCSGQDPDALFVRGKAQHDAKAICKGCPVLAQCLAEALDNRTEFGVWGGMTERERRALLRRRPDVRSWKVAIQSLEGSRGLPVAN